MSSKSYQYALAVAALALVPEAAHAQLATSPAPVQIPEVTVTAPSDGAGKAAPAPRPVKAPAAAQQSSTPRVQNKPEPIAEAPNVKPKSAPVEQVAVDPATVSVSPTGTTQSVEQIGSSVTVVTSQEIEAQQRRTANDVLRSVPGVNVVQSGGPGALTSLFVRGTNSNHTKVLIDGIDVSDPSSANRTFNFGHLTAFDLDRIEVLRGPQSGLYGADALGGVVVVYTKKGDGPLKVDALVEGGSFGTFNQALSARGSVDKFNYAFNVSHFQADKVAVTPVEILAPGVRQLKNSYDNWTYSTKLGVDVTRDVTLNLAVRYTDANYAFQSSQFDKTRSEQASDQFYTRGEAVWRLFDGRVTNYFGINYTDVTTDNTTPFGKSFADGQRVKYDWRSVVDVARGVAVTAGADYQKEKLQTDVFAADEANSGVYAQLQVEPVRNLFLVGNVRFDDNETFGSATTWRFAPAYVIEATSTKIKGSVGTAFKAPSLSQRYQDFAPFFFGNPNLRPEESTGYDIGFEQGVFNNRAQFGVTYFRNDITDLINGSFDTVRGVFSLDNVDKAKTSGYELFASADLTDTVRVRGDYTYTESIDVNTGADLKNRSRHKATVSAGWKPITPLLLTGSITYIGPAQNFDRVTFNDVTNPGFTLVNIAADYTLNDHMSLFGRIDNVFDKHYQNPNGYEGTGIGAYAGIKFRN